MQDWLRDDAEFKEAKEDVDQSLVDCAESQSMMLMRGIPLKDDKGAIIDYTLRPDTTMLIFFLKTKAKDRGYVERSEVTGKNGEALQAPSITFVPASRLTDEQINEYLNKDKPTPEPEP